MPNPAKNSSTQRHKEKGRALRLIAFALKSSDLYQVSRQTRKIPSYIQPAPTLAILIGSISMMTRWPRNTHATIASNSAAGT